MKTTILRGVRFAVALPLAIPLILLGWLGVKLWRPLGLLGALGFWMLCPETVFV